MSKCSRWPVSVHPHVSLPAGDLDPSWGGDSRSLEAESSGGDPCCHLHLKGTSNILLLKAIGIQLEISASGCQSHNLYLAKRERSC